MNTKKLKRVLVKAPIIILVSVVLLLLTFGIPGEDGAGGCGCADDAKQRIEVKIEDKLTEIEGRIDELMEEGYTAVKGQIETKIEEVLGMIENAAFTIEVLGQEFIEFAIDENGEFIFLFDPTIPGLSDLANYELLLLFNDWGEKIDLEGAKGELEDLGLISLNRNGSISGEVLLGDKDDHSGILVYIPGTSFSAYTDYDGNYAISNVPEGTYHSTTAEKDGYISLIMEDIIVEPEQDTSVESQEIKLSTGPTTEAILINNGAHYTTFLKVDICLHASTNASLMMISEDVNFINAEWEQYESCTDYTFDSDGKKEVYAKFGNTNGLESAPYSASIIVISKPSTTLIYPGDAISINNITPQLRWIKTILDNASYHIQLATDDSFSNLLLDVKDTFTESENEVYYDIEDPLDIESTYYWKVAIVDEDGGEFDFTEMVKFSVVSDTVDLIAPINGENSQEKPECTWSENEYAESYSFILSRNSDLSEPIVDEETSSLIYNLSSEELEEAIYFWAIAPIIGGITGKQSEIRSFTFDKTAPTTSLFITAVKPLVSEKLLLKLKIEVEDNICEPEDIEMNISLSSEFSEDNWQAFQKIEVKAISRELFIENKTIFIKLRDLAKNVSDIYTSELFSNVGE